MESFWFAEGKLLVIKYKRKTFIEYHLLTDLMHLRCLKADDFALGVNTVL